MPRSDWLHDAYGVWTEKFNEYLAYSVFWPVVVRRDWSREKVTDAQNGKIYENAEMNLLFSYTQTEMVDEWLLCKETKKKLNSFSQSTKTKRHSYAYSSKWNGLAAYHTDSINYYLLFRFEARQVCAMDYGLCVCGRMKMERTPLLPPLCSTIFTISYYESTWFSVLRNWREQKNNNNNNM